MLPQEDHLARMLQRWVTAFPYTLKCHLQEDSDLERELQVPAPDPWPSFPSPGIHS